jgi:hypothetical protein
MRTSPHHVQAVPNGTTLSLAAGRRRGASSSGAGAAPHGVCEGGPAAHRRVTNSGRDQFPLQGTPAQGRAARGRTRDH